MTNPTQSFQSQELFVDWISLKFHNLSSESKKLIIDSLANLQFNSYQQSANLSKPLKKELFVDSNNTYQVCFIQDHPYWEGTLIQFSGFNARRFYFLAKEQKIEWSLFSSGILSRLDLYFERKSRSKDPISANAFLEDSYKHLKPTNKNLKLEKNTKGFILRTGNPRSPRYTRIYQTETGFSFLLASMKFWS